ncbi:uncharacterized protein LOC118735753 [Rhagoletis pomonella]|uniref:uncharacterized protein LOC118735753 n=1 Tax=Rhagoletis pomonella TaxID=28610 RepID=UPI00177E0E7D|nr:uncharacterized protein LOC118735753 [Rhagoletis pomonella]
MNSLILMNYFEKQAKSSPKLQELMAQAAHCLLVKEELRSLENELSEETLTLTMDNYQLECVAEQLKSQYQQHREEQECMRLVNKHSVEFFVVVRNFDWEEYIRCKLELLQVRCQKEMLEMNEEYEAEQRRRNQLEQRKSVQLARAAQRELANMQAKKDYAKKGAAESEATLLKELKELRQKRNDLIVALVTRSKQIADRKKELETMKAAQKKHITELNTQKQELIAKLQKHETKLPGTTTPNEVVLCQEQKLPKINNAPATKKLEAFSNAENVSNATISVERKEPTFMDLFKEWEAKRQLQYQQLLATNTKAFSEITPAAKNEAADTLATTHSKPANNGVTKTMPRSILRRPSTEDEDNVDIVPKKRVHFATPEVEDREEAFVPAKDIEKDKRCGGKESKNDKSSTFVMKESNFFYNGNTTESQTWESESGKDGDTFVIEEENFFNGEMDEKVVDEAGKEQQNGTIAFGESNFFVNGDTETIEILSTGEVAENEQPTREEVRRPQPKKPEFIKASKLLKKAKLLGFQKINKTALPFVADKPKIEIQECRIIKPAGTKLPTKLPIELTPESTLAQRSINPPDAANAAQMKTDKVFKTPTQPTKRKARKMPDCDTFFREFLKQSNEGNTKFAATVDDRKVNGTNASSTAANASVALQASEEPKPKLKKTELDFERFFHETIMCSNESSVDSATEMQMPPSKNGKDSFLQFDMSFGDANQALLGESLNDFFGPQAVNNGGDDDDDDSSTFDFGGAKNSEMGKFEPLL